LICEPTMNVLHKNIHCKIECVVPLRKDKVFVSVVGILALASFKGTNYCIAFTTQMSSQQVVKNSKQG